MQGPGASSLASQPQHKTGSRPTSPDSQMTNSLHRATATIDEFTTALAKVSRAPSPDAADRDLLHCCCGREDCANAAAWTAFQNKLESRLILCAEVGQALLAKHEAYIRRHGLDDSDAQSDDGSDLSRPETPTLHSSNLILDPEKQVLELRKENSSLEKKLHAALLNAEISEASKKSLYQELDEAKESLSKLTINQAKSAGWDTRLNTISEEKDDLQQELDSERQRAKNAEAHVASLRERCVKLQSEMGRLYDELDQQKQSRTELSEEIVRDARARLQMVQHQQFGHSLLSDNPEITQMMESLVADNEALKRDVAELQNLLAESREDVRVLQEEVQESRVAGRMSRNISSLSTRPGHGYSFSWASSFGQAPLSPVSRSAAHSTQPSESLSPQPEARPLSPPESRAASERRFPALSSPRPKYPPSQLNLDIEDRNARIKSPDFPGKKSPRRPLFLLSQNKAVQTDDISWTSLLSPVHRAQTDDGSSSTPAREGRSESSSLADTHSYASTIAAVVDRANSLFTRMTQADARTLMNRLKRQRLAGDISHLSHATVSSILSDANSLRSHFRGVLEDERAISTCTRRDLRALLGLLREMVGEMGMMRIALNDVILDPSLAPKLSEAAMDPSKDLTEAGTRGAKSNASGWMAPLSKLFSGVNTQADDKVAERVSTPSRAVSGATAANATLRQKPPKFAPKSGPALAASATTVNVEFSGAGVGRSVTSSATAPIVVSSGGEAARSETPVPGTLSSRAVMGIFAGAPQPQKDDPWIFVTSKPDKRLRGQKSTMDMRTATLTRSAGRWGAPRLPRNVDAVVDSGSAIHDSDEEENDETNVPNTLLERTLRPRGLSDSSIRSTFLNDGANPTSPINNAPQAPAPTPISPVPVRAPLRGRSVLQQSTLNPSSTSRPSVLQAFSRAFAIPSLSTPPANSSSPPASIPTGPQQTVSKRAMSPRGGRFLPSIAGWAASQAGLDAEATEEFVGSVREREDDTTFARRAWHRDMLGREL
ncbi:uncharacterized protein FOMMEDRAFT_169713 [Fomitiporia mediterranea MF3/22]|uniref:uncharacterized protein n=1 Tax=Fomitiporia mediterranea (strain MF3/22) TaxID=694068 RepID=UPI00044082D3|nr:uncharacterized protein FOMMEDRAFT_169713 [Fomitiporia mediterranea MF3/22]EJD01634.1 hypothetical protein FOMMEDRAFT_169713 [Fomitiporia mediterranea MF3/22]